MPSATPPPNMKRVKLGIAGLAQQEFNALVAWHKKASLADPLLVVLFFHGQEPDPQNFAWTHHRLPDQIADCGKNAVLIAPTMELHGGDVVVEYVATRDKIATLVRQGLAAVRQALGQTADAAWVDQAFDKAGLYPVGYSNGYRGWRAVVDALRSPASTIDGPPKVIGHSLFDCLYWSTPLMEGVDRAAPPDNARFSAKARAILKSAFVTTHFTAGSETLLLQARFLRAMVGHDPSLTLHNQIPGSLGANEIVMTELPTPDHDQTVSRDNGLSHVVAAAAGFDLPASPSV